MADTMTNNNTVPPDEVRAVMRHWVTGVTVVAAEHEGVRHGMTVSSFASLSLEPPLVMVSIKTSTRTHDIVVASGAFGVTILASEQAEVSNMFAGREEEGDSRFTRFETYALVTGSPLLKGCLAVFDCEVESTYQAGTHTVFIGRVVATEVVRDADAAEPLIYFNQKYRKLIEV